MELDGDQLVMLKVAEQKKIDLKNTTGSSIFPLDLPIVSIKAYFEDYQDDIVILKITILLAMITVA